MTSVSFQPRKAPIMASIFTSPPPIPSSLSSGSRISAPGDVQLLIMAAGKKLRKLNETGKVTVTPRVTYTPTGGDPSARSRTVKLVKL